MIILDTDALSHHMKMNPIGSAIETRMKNSLDQNFRITSISVFEMTDGALALYKDLRKKRKDLIPGFNLIQEVVEYLALWRSRIRPYDHASDQIFKSFAPRLRQELGDDARIASVALVEGAEVWTCNSGDFKRVPGLIVYNAETGLRLA